MLNGGQSAKSKLLFYSIVRMQNCTVRSQIPLTGWLFVSSAQYAQLWIKKKKTTTDYYYYYSGLGGAFLIDQKIKQYKHCYYKYILLILFIFFQFCFVPFFCMFFHLLQFHDLSNLAREPHFKQPLSKR